MEELYSELIQGKSVALVGPGKYLLGREKGPEINDHDLIVRTNRGCELIEKYSSDFGSRTDILYSCLIEQEENAGPWSSELFVEKFKIKYLCTTPNMDMKGIAPSTDLHYMVDREKYHALSQVLPCRIIDHAFFTKIALEIRCRPTTGFITIHDILRHNPKQLSIYGFDFYYSGWVSEYKDGMKDKTINQVLLKTINSKRHIHKNMWMHAKQLLNDPRVSLDDQLKKVLTLDQWWFNSKTQI